MAKAKTWEEIKAERQSRSKTWDDIKKERGYVEPVVKESSAETGTTTNKSSAAAETETSAAPTADKSSAQPITGGLAAIKRSAQTVAAHKGEDKQSSVYSAAYGKTLDEKIEAAKQAVITSGGTRASEEALKNAKKEREDWENSYVEYLGTAAAADFKEYADAMDIGTAAGIPGMSDGSEKKVKKQIMAKYGMDEETFERVWSFYKLNGAELLNYLAGRAVSGAVGAGQGLIQMADYLAGDLLAPVGTMVDATLGQFGANTNIGGEIENWANNVWETDVIGAEALREDVENRYGGKAKSNATEFAGDLAESAGAMLPAMATGGAAGAAGLGSSMTQALNSIVFGGGAAGNAAKQALAEGANTEQAVTYGIASGMIEVLTESMFAGMAGMNKSAAMDEVLDKLTTNGTLRALTDILGEGAEEVVSEFLNPYITRATYNKEAAAASFNELARSFASGAALSIILGGASAALRGDMAAIAGDLDGTSEQMVLQDEYGRVEEQRERDIHNREESGSGETTGTANTALSDEVNTTETGAVEFYARPSRAATADVESEAQKTAEATEPMKLDDLGEGTEQKFENAEKIPQMQKKSANAAGTVETSGKESAESAEVHELQGEKAPQSTGDRQRELARRVGDAVGGSAAERVSGAELGIEGTTELKTVALLSNAVEKQFNLAEAKEIAEQGGYTPQFFSGVLQKSDNKPTSWGVAGKTLYIQADSAKRSAAEIAQEAVKTLAAAESAEYNNSKSAEQSKEQSTEPEPMRLDDLGESTEEKTSPAEQKSTDEEFAPMKLDDLGENAGTDAAPESAAETAEGKNEGQKKGAGKNAKVPNRGRGRDAGISSGRAAGRVSDKRESAARRAVDRRNKAKTYREIALRDLGVENAAAGAEVKIVPVADYDGELKKAAAELERQGVESYTFVLGALRLKDAESGKTATASGIYDELHDSIIIRVDSPLYTAEQLAAHETFHRMAAQDRNLVERTREKLLEEITEAELDELIKKYQTVYGNIHGMDAEAYVEEILADAYAGLNRALLGVDRYSGTVRKAVTETRRRPETRKQQTNGPNEGGRQAVRYSVNDGFSEDVREWYEEGQPAGERFILGSTGNVLQGLGAIESDIYINGDKISRILEEHPEMGINEVQRIPEVLEDPILILASRGKGKKGTNSRMVLYGSVKAKNGQPVLTVLDLRPGDNGFLLNDMQKVNSAYSKKNPSNFVKNSDVLYADKKRTIPLLRQFGLTITSRQLLQNGSIGSISYDGNNVKLTGVPFPSVVDLADNGGKAKFLLEDMSEEESRALLSYKSSESYRVNAKLRDGLPLTQAEQKMVAALDSALEKLPVHEGTVYRRISFDMEGHETLNAFLAEHEAGGVVRSAAYTSSSTATDGYPVDGELSVTQVINGKAGKDLAGIGNNNESEILFARNTRFHIESVGIDADGKTIIYMKEITNDGTGQLYPEEHSKTMQQVQASQGENDNLQSVPGVDTRRGADRGELPGVRGEGTEKVKFSIDSVIEDTNVEKIVERETAAAAAAAREARAPERMAGRLTNSRGEFNASPALDKLGVKIANSIGRYENVERLVNNAKAAKTLTKAREKAEKNLKATTKEKAFARGLAEGVYLESEIPQGWDKRTVLELADWYMAERNFGELYVERTKRALRRDVEAATEDIFEGIEETTRKISSPLVMNYRTATRNMLNMFGSEKGTEINRWLFEPVTKNEAERIRFINRELDKVRTFKDQVGKERALSKDERALVQKEIEGRAVEKRVKKLEENKRKEVEDWAENLLLKRKGKLTEEQEAYSLTAEEKKLAEAYADWLTTTAQIEAADTTIIRTAADRYSELFSDYYEAINDFLAAHGYQPIGFIEGYAPHLQPETVQNAFQSALQRLGINENVSSLPTSIAGMTADLRPNKKWNPYFLTRNGTATQFDIVKGFESYIGHLSEVLYHTDDIMRVRSAVRYFREQYSPDEIRNNIDWAKTLRTLPAKEQTDALMAWGIISNPKISSREAAALVDKFLDGQFEKIDKTSKYNNLVTYLDNYANILAGKQSFADRGSEYLLGRKILNAGNEITRIFSRANVAGNLSSALNQTAQLPTLIAENGLKNTANAFKDVVTGQLRKAGWADESDFLTGKKGVEFITTDASDMLTDIAFKPLQMVDGALSAMAVRSSYLKAIAQGMEHAEAMEYADKKAASIMGDRTKGAKPLAFGSKNPISSMVNLFQLEALNSWEHLTQDLPSDFRQIEAAHGRPAAARALANTLTKSVLYTFILNRLAEKLYGGTPAPFDILGLTANFIASGEGLSTNSYLEALIDSVMQALFGTKLFDTDDEDIMKLSDGEFDAGAGFEDLTYNISNEVPFLNNLSALLGLGDQTLPLPDVISPAQDAFKGIRNGNVAEVFDAAVEGLGEVVPAGRQLVKTYTGAKILAQGGRMKGYGSKQRLQYPVERTAGNAARALLFGASGLQETQDYYASGAGTLSAKETELWKLLTAAGTDEEESYNLIYAAKSGANEWEKVRIMAATDWPDATKYQAMRGVVSDSAAYKISVIENSGIKADVYAEALGAIYAAAEEREAELPEEERTERITVTQADATEALKAVDGLARAEKAVIWQMVNAGWSSSANPFGKFAGRRAKKEYEELKNEEDELELMQLAKE